MSVNIFKKAKAYSRKHPKIDWQECIQRVKGKKRKSPAKKKKKTSSRQTGTSNKKIDRERHAKHPGKRRSKTGNPYYERRANRSDKPGMLTGMSEAKMISEIKKRKIDRLGKVLAEKSLPGKTKTQKKKLTKRASEIKSSLMKLFK